MPPTRPELMGLSLRTVLREELSRALDQLTGSRRCSGANQILIFVADPPSPRHEDENSAILDEKLQRIGVDVQERSTRHAWLD